MFRKFACITRLAPSTVRPLARDPLVLIGWPFSFAFWSGRALGTGTAWAGLCLIHHHRNHHHNGSHADPKPTVLALGGLAFLIHHHQQPTTPPCGRADTARHSNGISERRWISESNTAACGFVSWTRRGAAPLRPRTVRGRRLLIGRRQGGWGADAPERSPRCARRWRPHNAAPPPLASGSRHDNTTITPP